MAQAGSRWLARVGLWKGQVEDRAGGSRLGKKHFFVNSEILGIQVWWKKCVNYKKFKIATRQRKSNI